MNLKPKVGRLVCIATSRKAGIFNQQLEGWSFLNFKYEKSSYASAIQPENSEIFRSIWAQEMPKM